MVSIVQREDKVLRETATEVAPADIQSPKIQTILGDMKVALRSQEDGVAIAAPQIGVSLRIFIVSGHVFAAATDSTKTRAALESEKDMVFINPVLTKLSKEKKTMSEGCLSVRYLYGDVMRSTRATVKAYNEHGELFERGASGLLAQIFQHETDHLDGVLFIDKAKNLEELPPEQHV